MVAISKSQQECVLQPAAFFFFKYSAVKFRTNTLFFGMKFDIFNTMKEMFLNFGKMICTEFQACLCVTFLNYMHVFLVMPSVRKQQKLIQPPNICK